MTKIVTIGSATMDVFVESDEANIRKQIEKQRKISFNYYYRFRRIFRASNGCC